MRGAHVDPDNVARLAIKFEQLNLPAAIFGIFMIQVIILADYLLNLITSGKNKRDKVEDASQ